jgi:hypothetical protein
MTNLIVQISCCNEEATLPIMLKNLPCELPVFSSAEWQIIHDGSSDRTIQVAIEHVEDHVIRHIHNLHLACVFL